ncbi:uncharacterized protein LOC122060622 [Macadamia integrifolia]|uniref:uncharacterized protein LOC122060622 n=1 Tax=Macadamia integrifolia TaxID=60698 RepID=UPI001C52811B|nr:uncharacterized protein LOC122060622 [Macadamia integrifolia]
MVDAYTSLIMNKPAHLTDQKTDDEKLVYVEWVKSNRICLLSMKRSIKDHLKSDFPANCTAKEMMDAVALRYRVSSNAEIGILLQKLFNLRYDGSRGVRDYIIWMVDYQTKLKALNISLPDPCIVHQVLNTLPSEFGIIKINYNSQDET